MRFFKANEIIKLFFPRTVVFVPLWFHGLIQSVQSVMAALRVINEEKSVMAGKETFFLLSRSATSGHLLDFTMAQEREMNAPLPAKTSPLPMASGYKNQVQHACPPQHSQGTQTSEQQTQPICWEKEFNRSPSFIFSEKENGTSGSLSELTVSIPMNSPSTSRGFFFFKHHKVSTSRCAEEGTRCR